MSDANWSVMTPQQRISAAHFDIMNHPEFALISGVMMMGKAEIDPMFPTACTDGRDCWYGEGFMAPLTRAQTRAVVLHENFHKMLLHCTMYKEAFKHNRHIANCAADYVVNGLIQQADPDGKFIEWWVEPKPIIDPKYYNMSFPKVFMDLLKNGDDDGGGKGRGRGRGEPMDEHRDGNFDPETLEKLDKEIQEAIQQGELLRESVKRRSKSGSGGALDLGAVLPRRTNWREHLRDFVCSVVRGNDVARWSRINSRMFAATGGRVLLPTLYNESVGPLVIAADTSGSMAGLYALLFGEIARVAQDARPESVTLIWWDTRVAGVQKFMPHEYDSIAQALKPAGGGGTDAQCAVDYINQNNIKPQCVIFLTDGYIGAEPGGLQVPVLWGVIDNIDWYAKTGKTMHISSLNP